MEKLSKSLKWIDTNLLKILAVFFIYFIPLYPKFPLAQLRDTYIAIRYEDAFMVLFVLAFVLQWLRKKVTLNIKFLPLFGLFWFAAFLSFIYGYFVEKTILFHYVGFLNAARRVEYMIPFFIMGSIIKSKDDFMFYMKHISIAAFIVFIYGIMQKYVGLPAVQTMNKEFAKGTILYLTPDARISSTFAGHYDLAAYAILMIPLLIGMYIVKAKKWFMAAALSGIYILVLTASRSSYGAFIIGTFPFLLLSKKWKVFGLVTLFTILLTATSGPLTDRFAQTFRVKQLFVNEATGQVILPQDITTAELPAGTEFLPIGNEHTTSQQKASSAALLKKQIMEDISREAKASGKELTETEILDQLQKRLVGFTPVIGVATDISFATRLQVEWPRAIKAFQVNPLLGTGPSSITEATDNSLLRWLGEFGLLGTALFISILIAMFLETVTKLKKIPVESRNIFLSFIWASVALVVNATYIDVFEASKVAFVFWTIAGVVMAGIPFYTQKKSHE